MPLWAEILILAVALGLVGFVGWYIYQAPYELRIGWRYLYSGQHDRFMFTRPWSRRSSRSRAWS